MFTSTTSGNVPVITKWQVVWREEYSVMVQREEDGVGTGGGDPLPCSRRCVQVSGLCTLADAADTGSGAAAHLALSAERRCCPAEFDTAAAAMLSAPVTHTQKPLFTSPGLLIAPAGGWVEVCPVLVAAVNGGVFVSHGE